MWPLIASASEAQARAAFESIHLLRERLEDELGLGRSIIHSSIDSAVSAISYWKQRPLTSIASAPGFPPSDDLIPPNALRAAEHARHVSAQASELLSSAFDDLRDARKEIERTRLLGDTRGPGQGFLEAASSKAPEYLDSALKKLLQVKAMVP